MAWTSLLRCTMFESKGHLEKKQSLEEK